MFRLFNVLFVLVFVAIVSYCFYLTAGDARVGRLPHLRLRPRQGDLVIFMIHPFNFFLLDYVFSFVGDVNKFDMLYPAQDN